MYKAMPEWSYLTCDEQGKCETVVRRRKSFVCKTPQEPLVIAQVKLQRAYGECLGTDSR